MSRSFAGPSIAEIGQTIWGPHWAEPMAEALHVSEPELVAWDAKPETIPTGFEDRIHAAGVVRIQEIQRLLAQLEAIGLRR
jgi:hypothetical protein